MSVEAILVEAEAVARRLTQELEELRQRFARSYVSTEAARVEIRRIRDVAAAHGLEAWRPNPTMDPLDVRFRSKAKEITS